MEDRQRERVKRLADFWGENDERERGREKNAQLFSFFPKRAEIQPFPLIASHTRSIVIRLYRACRTVLTKGGGRKHIFEHSSRGGNGEEGRKVTDSHSMTVNKKKRSHHRPWLSPFDAVAGLEGSRERERRNLYVKLNPPAIVTRFEATLDEEEKGEKNGSQTHAHNDTRGTHTYTNVIQSVSQSHKCSIIHSQLDPHTHALKNNIYIHPVCCCSFPKSSLCSFCPASLEGTTIAFVPPFRLPSVRSLARPAHSTFCFLSLLFSLKPMFCCFFPATVFDAR